MIIIWLGYFIGILIALYIILTGYIRIKMKFWRTQPVFHLYNLKYWFNPPGFINAMPPAVNKFVNLSNNKLIQVDASGADTSGADTSVSGADTSTTTLCKFISDYYVIHDSATYKPSEQDIMAYLQCTNQPSFFNVYQETALPFLTEQEIIGVTSTRVLNVTLMKKKRPIHIPVYYVDNLCVKPGHRNKGIAPEMIQTFYYRMSRLNPKINAYMFKREGQLNAIVPLVCYDTYAYDMTNFVADKLLNASMTLIDIGSSQVNILIAFIKEQLPKFECIILPDVSSVLNLLKLGKIKIYGILFQGQLIAIYVFRILALYYADKKAVECITILSTTHDSDILIAGFNMSWLKLNALVHCHIVLIEETAHSSLVIKALDKNPSSVCTFKSPTAFFLYNYATYSVKKTKALLLY